MISFLFLFQLKKKYFGNILHFLEKIQEPIKLVEFFALRAQHLKYIPKKISRNFRFLFVQRNKKFSVFKNDRVFPKKTI